MSAHAWLRRTLQNSHSLTRIVRCAGTKATDYAKVQAQFQSECGKFTVVNRNPRAIEQLGIKRKPRGYSTSDHDVTFFHRLRLHQTNAHITAELDVPDGSVVLKASTQEYNIGRHLYGYTDKAACMNLARVTAQRLHESGITTVKFDMRNKKYHGRVKAFLDTLKENGISLKGG